MQKVFLIPEELSNQLEYEYSKGVFAICYIKATIIFIDIHISALISRFSLPTIHANYYYYYSNIGIFNSVFKHSVF